MTNSKLTSKDYLEIRRRGMDLNGKIFKKLTQDDIKTCAKHLGIWRQKTLFFSDESEMDLFMDYVTLGYRPNGFNMAEKFLRLFHKEADDFELELLRHMRFAHYAIYQVEETNGLDTVHVVDFFSKVPYKLIDHQMAKTVNSSLMLAGHLVDFDDFTLQTGGTVCLTQEIIQADEFIRVLDRIDDSELGTFLNNPANGAKMARAIVSAIFRLGQSSLFEYKEP